MMQKAMDNFAKQFSEAQAKAVEEFTKQIAEENNVSEEVALYLITKQYNLKYDSEIEIHNGEPTLTLTFEPKSVDEILECVEDKTDWEKEMHKKFIDETFRICPIAK